MTSDGGIRIQGVDPKYGKIKDSIFNLCQDSKTKAPYKVNAMC